MNAQTCFDHFLLHIISIFINHTTGTTFPTHIILGKIVHLIIHDGFLAK